MKKFLVFSAFITAVFIALQACSKPATKTANNTAKLKIPPNCIVIKNPPVDCEGNVLISKSYAWQNGIGLIPDPKKVKISDVDFSTAQAQIVILIHRYNPKNKTGKYLLYDNINKKVYIAQTKNSFIKLLSQMPEKLCYYWIISSCGAAFTYGMPEKNIDQIRATISGKNWHYKKADSGLVLSSVCTCGAPRFADSKYYLQLKYNPRKYEKYIFKSKLALPSPETDLKENLIIFKQDLAAERKTQDINKIEIPGYESVVAPYTIFIQHQPQTDQGGKMPKYFLFDNIEKEIYFTSEHDKFIKLLKLMPNNKTYDWLRSGCGGGPLWKAPQNKINQIDKILKSKKWKQVATPTVWCTCIYC